jgi:hypothetical protein
MSLVDALKKPSIAGRPRALNEALSKPPGD